MRFPVPPSAIAAHARSSPLPDVVRILAKNGAALWSRQATTVLATRPGHPTRRAQDPSFLSGGPRCQEGPAQRARGHLEFDPWPSKAPISATLYPSFSAQRHRLRQPRRRRERLVPEARRGVGSTPGCGTGCGGVLRTSRQVGLRSPTCGLDYPVPSGTRHPSSSGTTVPGRLSPGASATWDRKSGRRSSTKVICFGALPFRTRSRLTKASAGSTIRARMTTSEACTRLCKPRSMYSVAPAGAAANTSRMPNKKRRKVRWLGITMTRKFLRRAR